MSSHTPTMGESLDDATWRPKMANITQWLQGEWSALEEKFNASALGSIQDLMEKAPALLTKLDELNGLKRHDLN